MTPKRYDIFLDNIKIGTTELENADAPVGVVFGEISFVNIPSGYNFLKTYCATNNLNTVFDYPEDKLLATSNLPGLKVTDPDGTEIKGEGSNIEGTDNDGFEITIVGIAYPFFGKQFPHHIQAYLDKLNED